MAQSTSIAHSIDQRRPTRLDASQILSINDDPNIVAMKRQLQKIPRDSEQRKEGIRAVRNAKQRLKQDLLKKIRSEWTGKQAVEDIERQLRGERLDTPLSTKADSPQHPAHKELVAALTASAQPTLGAQYRRRNRAIHAITAYCSVEEGNKRRPASALMNRKGVGEPAADTAIHRAMLSVFRNDEKERPKRCFVCVGKAMLLRPDDPSVSELISEFYSPSDLARHFHRRHLLELRDNQSMECHVCCLEIDHKKHLQEHALRVHGTRSGG